MFQGFTETAQPELGPARLSALRDVMAAQEVDGFLVPRADMFQGEYVAARDDRLAWLTGFTGSAGFCAAMTDRAGVFVDSRYRVQVKAQVADVYSPVDWPEIGLAAWLKEALPEGGHVGFDPWLHTVDQIKTLRDDVATAGIELVELPNLVDMIWDDQPDAPVGPVIVQPLEFAGEAHADKIARLGQSVGAAGAECVVLTLPDSIAWLLNIRGSDIPRNPVAHATAITGRGWLCPVVY
ncbi:putative Xaa-Pro aminopeptidase P [Nymphon striatum]|nr:putative Xaa-Pro aminopeptidase P [Nymphon striatum]